MSSKKDRAPRCPCGEPLPGDSPRFRAGGPTAMLCWICARIWHTVNVKCKDCGEHHE